MRQPALHALLVSVTLLHAALAGADDNWQAVNVAGQFGLHIKSPTEGHLCVVDANADGLSDIVLSRHGQDPWPLMRQRADGSFFQAQSLGPRNDRHSCASGDFASVNPDGSFGPPDGRPDFYITTGACEGQCTKEYPNYLHIQRPDGSFQDAAVAFGVRDPHGRGRETLSFDANVDGLDDLFFTNQISTLYPATGNRLYLNTGSGLVEWIEPALTQSLETVCARAFDFNDDGRTDLIVCTSNRTYFLANTAVGFIDVRAQLGLSAAYRDVAVADLNGDGHSDLVGIEKTKLTVRLWRPAAPVWGAVAYAFSLSQGRTAAVSDLFGSGFQRDIFVVDGWLSGSVLQHPDWVLRWTGTSTIASFQVYPVPAPSLANIDIPQDGEGDRVAFVPNWAGTGRDLAVVSNGKYSQGYYQAIVMWRVTGVPNVVGLLQSAAASLLEGAGLVVGVVTSQDSATVPVGSVISQDPAAATAVAEGSSVNLVISTGASTAIVPDVVGLTQAAATSAISDAALVLGSISQQASGAVPAGSVINQNPAAGLSVATGSAVNLVVSSGAPTTTVPDVVGLSEISATNAIAGAGLVLGGVSLQSSSSVPTDHVISQSPAAGTSVTAGTAVNLTVSTGAATTTVPVVAGLTEAAATTAITSAGLVVGAVSNQSSATVPVGRVISQSPPGGTSVEEGSAVDLVVSTGA